MKKELAKCYYQGQADKAYDEGNKASSKSKDKKSEQIARHLFWLGGTLVAAIIFFGPKTLTWPSLR